MIPEGKYLARAQEAEFGIAETSGNEQVGVAFRITKGEYEGMIVPWYSYFNTDANASRTMRSLRACGWKGDDITNLDGISENEVTIDVEINEYDGKLSNRVAWVNGGGVAMKTVMDDRQKRAFAARMKGLAAASRGNAPSTRAVPTRPDRQPQHGPPQMGDEPAGERSYGGGGFGGGGDDIPF